MNASPAAAVDRILQLAESGESDLASIEAIRSIATTAARAGADDTAASAMQSALLSDLGALRFAAGDPETAASCLRTAVVLAPDNSLAAENLAAAEEELKDQARETVPGDPGATAEEWVADALAAAQDAVGLHGKDVLEIGGLFPSTTVQVTGAKSWEGAQPDASGRWKLPHADASFDVVLTSCALEQQADVPGLFDEVSRVLRPGGTACTQFGPLWSSSIGHELWLLPGNARRVHQDHPVLPNWAHLLLTQNELACFLLLALGADAGEATARQISTGGNLNRLFEADYVRAFDAAGLKPETLATWGGRSQPSHGLLEQLQERYPDAGDFEANGLRAVLIKA